MRPSTPKAMIVAGVMSGTSADGVDVAICRIATGGSETPRLKLLAHQAFPYPRALRLAVLAAMDAQTISAAELARLSWRLGEVYSDAIEATATAHQVKPQLAVIHVQTIYHQGKAQRYLGKPLRCTWQMGEAAVLAERLRLPVVSDLRPADLAAGGQGAPLVPMLDFCLFRHATRHRLLLNLGGIANVTALPAGCRPDEVLAFDIGPANMLIDACMTKLFGKPLDRHGATAAKGRVLQQVVDMFLREKVFTSHPPKSLGREEFGTAFAETFMATCRYEGALPKDVVATATALTVEAILQAYRSFCVPHLERGKGRPTDLIVAGGGAHNRTLLRLLTEGFAQLKVTVSTTGVSGMPVEAKEAAAFALLGWLTWHGLPGNIPSATGAGHPTILGKVTYV
jgi:anhydro-N-acetylmuramic acid kinase